MGYLHVSLTSELFVKGIALKKHLKNGVAEQKYLRSPALQHWLKTRVSEL